VSIKEGRESRKGGASSVLEYGLRGEGVRDRENWGNKKKA